MGVTSRQEIVAQVEPRLVSRLALSAYVYCDRLRVSAEFMATVSPRLAARTRLRAAVINEQYETAAQGRVLAPAAEITFTREESL